MENIKEKIQKLLNLSESDNEHEAASALAKAMELMNKWNLDLAMVTGQKVELQEYNFPFTRWTGELQELAVRVLSLSDCSAVYRHGRKEINTTARMYISGRPRDIQNFIYLFEFIRDRLKKESQKFKLSIRNSGSNTRNNLETKSFRFGFIETICAKLKNSRQMFFTENKALISIDSEVKLKEARDHLYQQMEENIDKRNKPNKTVYINESALKAGKNVASEIDLNVAVNGKSQNKLEYKK